MWSHRIDMNIVLKYAHTRCHHNNSNGNNILHVKNYSKMEAMNNNRKPQPRLNQRTVFDEPGLCVYKILICTVTSCGITMYFWGMCLCVCKCNNRIRGWKFAITMFSFRSATNIKHEFPLVMALATHGKQVNRTTTTTSKRTRSFVRTNENCKKHRRLSSKIIIIIIIMINLKEYGVLFTPLPGFTFIRQCIVRLKMFGMCEASVRACMHKNIRCLCTYVWMRSFNIHQRRDGWSAEKIS